MKNKNKALLVESLKNERLNSLMFGDGSNYHLDLRKVNVAASLYIEKAYITAHYNSLHPGINFLINYK